jgi:hypothetical protein
VRGFAVFRLPCGDEVVFEGVTCRLGESPRGSGGDGKGCLNVTLPDGIDFAFLLNLSECW